MTLQKILELDDQTNFLEMFVRFVKKTSLQDFTMDSEISLSLNVNRRFCKKKVEQLLSDFSDLKIITLAAVLLIYGFVKQLTTEI